MLLKWYYLRNDLIISIKYKMLINETCLKARNNIEIMKLLDIKL